MLSVLIPCAVAILCFVAARRSLKLGIGAVLTAGYLYGIMRANLQGTWTYLMFDLSILGLYAAQLFRPDSPDERVRLTDLRFWTISLIVCPAVLFAIFLVTPSREPLVELVGLRGNVFLIPFLILGGRLTGRDIRDIAIYCAVLNLGAVALGAAEFAFGIERFYPLNETTEIIYRSRDLVGYTAHRIPGSFVNAHAFAGTMATTLPLVLGAWAQPDNRRWIGPLLASAAVASFIGIFMAAARTHMITAAALVIIVTVTGGLSRTQWIRWVLAVGLVGYVVAADARLQRFTTLADQDTVSQRIGGSVNQDFFELAGSYPLGHGLTSGGTSVPYFLQSKATTGMLLESEYARITLEQGVPGLLLWLFFIAWVVTRFPTRAQDSWLLGRRLAWAACISVFVSGMLGIGMMASVPQTSIMLLLVGWFSTSPAPEKIEEPEPETLPQSGPAARRRPSHAPGLPSDIALDLSRMKFE